MYIDIVPNRNSPPAVLLRESTREGNRTVKRTIANLSSLPMDVVDTLRRALRGEKLLSPDELFEPVLSAHHGQVQAALTAIRRLGLDQVLGTRRSRERDLVVGMIAARVLRPSSKLATTRWWHTTTLPEELGVSDADEDELYDAMDWLVERQDAIEKKLAARHLVEKGLVLYDLSSTWLEGKCCPLGALGHDRDKKGQHKLLVTFGLLTDQWGCPVSVSVFKGNTADATTVMEQVEKVQQEFGVQKLVLVGDRGMITQSRIDELDQLPGVNYITALRSHSIRKLVEGGALQLGLFDERNLFEILSPDYPLDRLVACRNPELARYRAQTRQALLAETAKELEKVRSMVERGRLRGKAEIGLRIGKVLNRYKVGKHFKLEIEEDSFRYHLREEKVAAEAALDGIYVIRTSLFGQDLSAADVVRCYKDLTKVERAFRSMKTVQLLVRPIFHWQERRVRAHIFLCMLAYYVQWHMEEAWRDLLFHDEEIYDRKEKDDPVAPAKRSPGALAKAASKRLPDGSAVHSFRSLLEDLSTIVRNQCRRRDARDDEPTFDLTTRPSPIQQRALDLLAKMTVYPV